MQSLIWIIFNPVNDLRDTSGDWAKVDPGLRDIPQDSRILEMADLREFGSFSCPGDMGPGHEIRASKLFGCFAGVWEFGKTRRAPRSTGTYPQVMHNFREFGSLRV